MNEKKMPSWVRLVAVLACCVAVGGTVHAQTYRPASVKEAVAPLLTDEWEQYAPYYRRCPVTAEGDTCCVGCVALAMGEVMRYYEWPAQGTGQYSYTDLEGCGQELTADFSAHTYDWANMLDDYYGTFCDEEADAVALLLGDCGVGVNMQYGVSSSGARSIYQPQALHAYFGYDEGMQYLYRNFFPQQEWDSILFTELSEGRPLLLSAYSMSLAHAMVCDGYDEEGYFHVVWGNEAGDANGYYYMNYLTPDQPTWYDKDSPEGGLNLLQSIVRGVEPEAGGTARHFYGFSHIDCVGEEADTVRVEVACLCNVGWQLHEGRVALALKGINDPDTTLADSTRIVYTYARQFALEEVDDTVYTDTISLARADIAAQGRLVPVFEQDGTFIEARTMVGTPNYLVTDEEGGLEAPTQGLANLVVSNVNFPDSVEVNTKPEFAFTVTNTGAEYSGRIYIALTRSSDPTANIWGELGLSLSGGESVDLSFVRTRVTNVSSGLASLRIMADMDLFTDSLNVLYEGERSITVLPSGYYTSISDPVISTDSSTPEQGVYDLSGRRMREDAPLPPGIYIVGGRKVLVRAASGVTGSPDAADNR